MMFSNSVKISLVAVALLMSCDAFAQEQAEKPVATIESDDRETLELFLDWAGIRTSVRRSFQEQGMEIPAALEEWLAQIRGRLTIDDDMIAIWPVGADRRSVQDFVDELFHVFRNSIFRRHSIERLNRQIQQLERERSEGRSALREGMGEWRHPEQIAQEYLQVKKSLYKLDLNSARTRARLGALQEQIEQRIEELRTLAETQAPAVELNIDALQSALESRRAELQGKERLFEKEFITKQELRAQEVQLLELESALAEQMAALKSLRLGQGDDTIRELKNLLIESEGELAGRLAGREFIEQRLAELQERLHAAGEQTRHENELNFHNRNLSRALNELMTRDTLPLTPIEGLPQLRLRWVN